MAKLKQLKCPSCGAVLELDFPNQITTVCPYCHQQVVYTKDNKDNPHLNGDDFNCDTKKDIKNYGIPFKDSDDNFREKVIRKIANDNGTPIDFL